MDGGGKAKPNKEPILYYQHPSMDAQTYPGQGLSIPQLVFALKRELRRAAYSPSYVVTVDSTTRPKSDIRTSTATASTTPLNWIRISRPSWRLFVNGETHLFQSTASRRIYFLSSLPISLTRATVSAPASFAFVGAESFFDAPSYGPSCSSGRVRTIRRLF